MNTYSDTAFSVVTPTSTLSDDSDDTNDMHSDYVRPHFRLLTYAK